MMQLATIASFVVLLCGFFGTRAANDDQNTTTGYNVTNLTNGVSNLCIFGNKSVSTVLFTSDIPNGTYVQVNESCNRFVPSKPVIFITHGFIANAFNYYFSDFAFLLVKNGYTVFSLDWSNLSCYNDPTLLNLLEYPAAVHNTRKVGEHLASNIKAVIDNCHVPLKNITLMGHSLGAHVSGFAAKNLQNSSNYGQIPLLIGTDPAAPGFMDKSCENRFCDTDAFHVIAFHTSILGIKYSIANLDLWFNNGYNQPACGGYDLIGLKQIIGTLNVNCSHNIAIEYLAMLLDNCEYISVPVLKRMVPLPGTGCSSDRSNCFVVDKRIFDSNYTTTGDYCVTVASKFPYCTKDDFNCQK